MSADEPPVVRWDEIDHVLLDMDGTILDLAFDTHFWTELVPDRYAALNGISVAQARSDLAPHFLDLQGQLRWYCLDHWSALTGLELAALKREARARIRPLPGSLAFLQAARRHAKTLWLVTNAHADSWRLKLEHTGLGEHFDTVICSHDFGAPKEDAAFWHACSARHPFDRRRALFVDDSLPVLRAARDWGIAQVVAIRHPDSSQPPREIKDFHAVDRLVDLLPR